MEAVPSPAVDAPLATPPNAAPINDSIALFDLKRQQTRLRAEIDRRVAAVLDHGQFILGPEVAELERNLCSFTGVRHAVGVSSGRDALIMALMAYGIGPGDAVFVPAFTFSATAAVVIQVGAAPIFVDVADDYNMAMHLLDEAILEARSSGLAPKAIMPVDLFGRPADYRAAKAFADVQGLALIGDAAQSFGARTADGAVGALAPITCVSFYPTKPLGAFGDGGAILTDNDELADAVRAIRTHGRAGDGDVAMRIGMTGRLDTIQAAVLLAKLSAFPAELERRAAVAERYRNRLEGAVALPPPDDDRCSAWALYTVRVDNRDSARAALGKAGIGTGLFYRVPLHHHPAFTAHATRAMPKAEAFADTVLSLPIGPDMTDAEVDRVAETLVRAIG